MKKSRLLLAAGVFTVALGAAFATKAHQNDPLMGYAKVGANCQLTSIPSECGPEHSNICTVQNITYFESRNENDPSVCVTELRKP